VWFDEKGYVTMAKARRANDQPVNKKNRGKRSAKSMAGHHGSTKQNGTPLEKMASGEF
jgi:hypothetical protein